MRLRLVSFSLSLYRVYKFMVGFRVRPAKRRAQNLQGTSSFYVHLSLCNLEGGSLDGGDLVSPRCIGPSRLTSGGCGAAHGPRHPAYLLFLGSKGSGLFRFMSFLGSGFARSCQLGSKNYLLALVAL